MRDEAAERLEAVLVQWVQSNQITDALNDLDELRQEPGWYDWLAWLDKHYPADVFTGESGDSGPRAIAAFRRELGRSLVAGGDKKNTDVLPTT